MRRIACLLALVALLAAPASAQQLERSRLGPEAVQGVQTGDPPWSTAGEAAPLSPPAPLRLTGDFRLMAAGAAFGGGVGYLTGWGVAQGIASVIETRDGDVDAAEPYLLLLPPILSGVGAVTGASRFSCSRLSFGSLLPLDSCADPGATLLGALPGAVALYLAQTGGVGGVTAAIAVEAVGAALGGMLARERRSDGVSW